MIEHFIILYSDYKSGRRIAYHYSDISLDGLKLVTELMDSLNKEFSHLSFGFHHLQTEKHSWESVINYDRFFGDVESVEDLKIFKSIISDDYKISALDVANLITARMSCTHLKLQKLIYLFYCNFIKKYSIKPFEEDFSAWQYGPVIKEVYDKYKTYGRKEIFQEDDSLPISKEKDFKLSAFSRFMKTPMHQNVLETIDATIAEYGSFEASKLVDITHIKDGPWDKTYRVYQKDSVIPYNFISEYCVNENS